MQRMEVTRSAFHIELTFIFFSSKTIRIPLTKWSFSLNPGPFNMKEHVLITIFASTASNTIYAMSIVTIMKAYYDRHINLLAAFLLAQTTQLLEFAWAGLFRKYLVDSPYMWWPGNLVQVSLFRALHDKKKRPKGGLSRLQFFMIVLVASLAYYVLSSYLFGSLTTLLFVCGILKDSIIAQQIGSGLGIGSFALDSSATSSYLGSPLETPTSAIFNAIVGYSLIVDVLVPIAYWANMFQAKSFPIVSSNLYNFDTQKYNITQIINQESFTIDNLNIESYSKIHLANEFVFSYGVGLALLVATIVHVALFNGSSIWRLWRQTVSLAHDKYRDLHSRLMKKYESVPQWWFWVILIIVLGLSLFACLGFNRQLQLPFWGLSLACGVAMVFTLPIGMIKATTNQQLELNVITELIIGYLYPGKPLANVAFKTYGCISMTRALWFLRDFKLGHYMKIPPKSMFVAQLVGTVVATCTSFAVSWFLLTSVENICDPDKQPIGSSWKCPQSEVFCSTSVIRGVVGSYSMMNYFFLIGLLAPILVWLLFRVYPKKKWIKIINMPVILAAAGRMPSSC